MIRPGSAAPRATGRRSYVFVFFTFLGKFPGRDKFTVLRDPGKISRSRQWMEFRSDFGRTVGWANWHGVNETGNPFFLRFDKR